MSKPTTATPATLRAVFGDLRADEPNLEIADDAALATAMKNQAGIVEWTASSSLIPHVAELLDVPLPDLLIRYWQKTDEVREIVEASKASPTEKMSAALYDSESEATYDPSVEIRFNGISPGKKIPFKVVLPLTFKGVMLFVQNGQIVDVSAGNCDIGGSVKLGDLTVVKLRNPVTIALPGLLRH